MKFNVTDRTDNNTGDTVTNAFHLVSKRTAADTSDIYIDNYEVKEVPESMTVATSGIANGATVDGTTAEITYTFSNKPYKMLAENVIVTPAAEVSVTAVDETSYKVSLSGLKPGTNYTISLSGVQDMYAQPAASTLAFITASAVPVSTDITEGLSFVSSNSNNQTHATVTTSGDITSAVKNDGHTYAVAQINGMPFESGKMYIAAGYVQNADETPAADAEANIAVSLAGVSKHNYTPSLPFGTIKVKIADNQWHRVMNVISIDPQTCPQTDDCAEECKHNGIGAHAGVQTNSTNKSFNIKDFQVRKLKALDINNNYLATIVADSDDKATLFITGPESAIYFMAVSYGASGASEINFGSAALAEESIAEISITAGDNYRIFIWDSNMNPLCNTFMGSDL